MASDPVSIPRWSVHVTAGLAALATLVGVYFQAFPPKPEVLTLAAANAALAESVAEYGLHIMETPSWKSGGEHLSVMAYDDGCVAIVRKTPTKTVSRLIVDLARSAPVATRRENLFVVPLQAVEMQGRCWNPHPGQFTWYYGNNRGEWVEVWRNWPDGCQHVQMFHPPTGTWASNSDGSPAVQWTQCRH